MSEVLATFLYEASKTVPKNDIGNFMRFYLIEKCYLLRNVNLPAQNFKSSIMCQTCGIQLTEVAPKVVIKKQKKANRLIRRLMRLESRTVLNKLQKKLLNNYRKKGRQKIITICRVCNKKTIETVDKPVFKNVKTINETVKTKTKKRGRKNEFSGLNKQAVLSVSKQRLSNTDKQTNQTEMSGSKPLLIKNKKASKPNKKQRNKKRLNAPNEVLVKSVNTRNKKEENVKNISNLLQKGSGSSSSLSDFLRNL